jgi:lysophospholipase L1-like esterase
MSIKSSRRRKSLVVLWNAAILVVLLAAIELVFGTWLSEESLARLAIKRNIRDVHDVNQLYSSQEPIRFIRDRFGLRGRYGSPDDIDILAVGGSTTNERYVSEGETWTSRLARLLAEADIPLKIANAGHDGHSTLAHIRSFDAWFPKIPGLRPRYVLVYVGINDVAVHLGAEQSAKTLEYSDPWRRLRKYITHNSAIAGLYMSLRGYIDARRMQVVHQPGFDWSAVNWTGAPTAVELPADLAARVAAYRRRLEQLNARVKDFGSVPIYVTQIRCSTGIVDGKQHWVTDKGEIGIQRQLLAFDEEMVRFCADSGEICVPLHREFTFEPGDCYDYVHTTDRGAARVADYLFGKLAPMFRRRH